MTKEEALYQTAYWIVLPDTKDAMKEILKAMDLYAQSREAELRASLECETKLLKSAEEHCAKVNGEVARLRQVVEKAQMVVNARNLPDLGYQPANDHRIAMAIDELENSLTPNSK